MGNFPCDFLIDISTKTCYTFITIFIKIVKIISCIFLKNGILCYSYQKNVTLTVQSDRLWDMTREYGKETGAKGERMDELF